MNARAVARGRTGCLVGEGVPARGHVEQADVGVHARAVDPEDRLGHERGVEPVALRDRLEREFEGDRVVRGPQRVRVLEIDLVLAGRDLVVGGLDLDPERLQRVHHVLADLLGEVGGEVEVAGLVVREWGDPAIVVTAEQEELELGAGVHHIAEAARALDLVAQHAARVTDEGLAAGREHVADDPGRTARPRRLLPRDLDEGGHVGHQVLIALRDPREALDRAAVEPGAVADRSLQLVDGDGHGLDVADDVRELELDEADSAGTRGLDLLDAVHPLRQTTADAAS